ncbi:hypothetical protein EKP33_04360 [Campylobacter upsaliensis]|nr:hypothetical protein [Campylobacter upsaliensis]
MKLDVERWKPFKIQRTKTQAGLFEIENCKCNCAGQLDDGLDINYIGAKKNDNGVMRSVALNEALISKGHGIMFICDGEGSVGYTNYIDKDFIGSTTTAIGYDEALTQLNAMFLISVLDNEKFRYSYGRKYRNHLGKMEIYLPAKHNLNGSIFRDTSKKYSKYGYVPDFEFMENYIKSLHYKPLTTKNRPENALPLNIEKWGEFSLNSLFEVVLSKGDIKIDEVESGLIPLVSSGETNNGVVGYIDSRGDGKAEIFKGNTITIDMFCNAFYQKDDFYAVSHGRVNILKPKFILNQYIAIFIITLIHQNKYRYSYGRALYSDEAKKMTIKLPINHKGELDFDFMENYIKSLPYGDRV